jgi:hypothetical protein
MCVCLSGRMKQIGFHWTEFRDIWFLSVFFFFFRKSAENIQVPLISDKNRTVHEVLCIFMVISSWTLLIMRNVTYKSCRENQNTRFVFNYFFFRKSCHFRDNVKKIWYSLTGHRWPYNTAHAVWMLHNWGYINSRRICNTYCFSTATIVTRMLLIVELYVQCSSCVPILQPRTNLQATDQNYI